MRVAVLASDSREVIRDYAAPAPSFGTATEALLQGLSRWPTVEVHVVSCLQQPVRSPEKLAPNIWYHALHVPKLGWLRTGYQGCIRAVRRKLKALQPNIAHGQGTERDCAISTIFCGVPNVITIHGHMRRSAELKGAKPFSFHWLAARLEQFTLPRAGGVICLNRYTQETVRSVAQRTWLIPNAVDPSFFQITPAPTPARTILCVGSIVLWKNQHALIRALDPIAAEKGLRLLFLGSGEATDPYTQEFFEMVKTRPWCVYGGFADRDKLKEHLGQATLLALPSLQDNCPMAVLEAMAAGVPVCAARVGGVPEIIEDGVNGLLCDPNEPSSLRVGIERLWDNPPLRQQLAARAKTDALARYHPEQIARQHVDIYREVLSTAS